MINIYFFVNLLILCFLLIYKKKLLTFFLVQLLSKLCRVRAESTTVSRDHKVCISFIVFISLAGTCRRRKFWVINFCLCVWQGHKRLACYLPRLQEPRACSLDQQRPSENAPEQLTVCFFCLRLCFVSAYIMLGCLVSAYTSRLGCLVSAYISRLGHFIEMVYV